MRLLNSFKKSLSPFDHLLTRYRVRKVALTPRRVTTRLEDIEIDRPLFLLGVQGGGLTILAKCFQRLENTCFVHGNADSWDAADNEMHVCETSQKLPREFSFHTNDFYPPNLPTNFYRYWTYATNEGLPHFRIDNPEQVSEASLNGFRNYVKAIIRAHAKNLNDCRFIDKSQLYTINIPLLRAALRGHSPRFVVIGRNPYGCIPRTARNYYLNPKKHGFDMPYEEALKLCSEHWNNSFAVATEDCHGFDDSLILNIEDFFANPKEFCSRICSFAELDFDRDMIPAPDQPNTRYQQMATRWYPLRKSHTERKLLETTQREREIINSVGGSTIEKLGYDLLK